jgi:hypothetical protein
MIAVMLNDRSSCSAHDGAFDAVMAIHHCPDRRSREGAVSVIASS